MCDSCTIIVDSEYGHLNKTSGQYSGSIGRVQRGEADFMAVPVYFPLHDPNQEYFEYSKPLLKDRMMIGSSYNYTEEYENGDITDMLTSVSSEYWWSALASFVTHVILIHIGGRIFKRLRKIKHWKTIKVKVRDRNIINIPIIQVNGKKYLMQILGLKSRSENCQNLPFGLLHRHSFVKTNILTKLCIVM